MKTCDTVCRCNDVIFDVPAAWAQAAIRVRDEKRMTDTGPGAAELEGRCCHVTDSLRRRGGDLLDPYRAQTYF